MATNTIYVQFPNTTPDELKATVIQIPSSSANQVSKPDLEDNQKRWLVVGICLHSVVTPTLRRYLTPVIQNLYSSLKRSDNIDKQTFSKYLKRYPPTNTEFNYEAINNNITVPRIQKRKDLSKYDFKVKNAVDLSKLFMLTHMAHYTGFNDTCDSSALLGLIINIDKFPSNVKIIAERLRRGVRNPWAHCDFTEWDNIKYLDAFQLMNQLASNLNLSKADEQKMVGDLTKWETNGIHFLEGTTIGLEILEEISKETKALARYVLAMTDDLEKEFKKVNVEIVSIHALLTSSIGRLERVENEQLMHERQLEAISLGNETMAQEVTLLGEKYNETVRNVQCIRSDITGLKEDIRNIKYSSHEKPGGMVYFYPPNRTKCFVGRSYELNVLQGYFMENRNCQYDHVICGLGGCGKTTLANEFSWSFQELYPGGVFWMSAESNESLVTSASNLAFDVGTTGCSLQETFIRTLKWIASLKENWLLVVDNVDSDEITGNMKDLLIGTWKRNTCGHMLITSRREPREIEESFQLNKECCLLLDTLNTRDGTTFLKLRTERDVEDERELIFELMKELGGLPLALEQAGAYIKAKKCSFEQYMTRFRKKRLKLLNVSAATTTNANTSKERLAVKTTWQLNFDYIRKHSEEEGIGTAAVTVMEIAAYLYADDIPINIINKGSPKVEQEDITETFDDSLGVKEIIEILTRFSLFQQNGNDTLEIHRLCQEVIRESMSDLDHVKRILQSATRMVNCALNTATSPHDVLCVDKIPRSRRGSLYLWGKLAANANVLKQHLFDFSQKMADDLKWCLNTETVTVLQTSAIFHSVHQRQDQALADQARMLHIMAALDITNDKCQEITSIKIPLLEKDRTEIQNCLSSILKFDSNNDITTDVCDESEKFRLAGNSAYTDKRYQDAIQYYTEGIRSSHVAVVDYKLFSNRSLMHLKIEDYEKALADANECISLEPHHWKGYCWKACAIANLVKIGVLPPEMKSVGFHNLQEKCRDEYTMKINYPPIVYKTIQTVDDIEREINGRTYTTLLLRKGLYTITIPFFINENIQLIGVEEGVELDFRIIVNIPCSSSGKQIHAHFENVCFMPDSEQVNVYSNAIATFYRCKLSNGQRGCEDFPRCTGGSGCVGKTRCSRLVQGKTQFANYRTGEVGHPGVSASDGGKVYLNSCILHRCGGGGVLVNGNSSYLEIRNCTVQRMRQMGIEARNGGRVRAENNVIINNQFHGILLDSRGFGIIRGNTIRQNGQEGIFCGGVLLDDIVTEMNYEEGSKAVIADNIIIQNGLSGMSLDGGTFEVTGNKIVDNWLWGIMIKSRSAAFLFGNDIFENKCGGIRIGTNYSASVILDSNTIRDHTGPDIFIMNSPDDFFKGKRGRKKAEKAYKNLSLAEEKSMYSRPPIITSRNIMKNNNKGMQHPREAVKLVKSCSYCFHLLHYPKKCSKCRTATYCSKQCQTSHWIRHKHMCKILHSKYIIEIPMNTTQPNQPTGDKHIVGIRTFHPSLRGIREGPAPDPTTTTTFIVKIQSGQEYGPCEPEKLLLVYDRSVSLDISFSCPELYHLVNECGVLAGENLSTKKIFCWAFYKDNGKILCFQTDNLPPFQTW